MSEACTSISRPAAPRIARQAPTPSRAACALIAVGTMVSAPAISNSVDSNGGGLDSRATTFMSGGSLQGNRADNQGGGGLFRLDLAGVRGLVILPKKH